MSNAIEGESEAFGTQPLGAVDDSIVFVVPDLVHVRGLDALLNDATVAKWLGGSRTRDSILKAVRDEREHWQRHGFGPCVVLDRTSGAVVGRGGLRWARVREQDEVELFYAVAPTMWGRGIATALAKAALEHGFSHAGLESVVAFTLEANTASQRVIHKLHFVREATFEHAGLPHTLFRRFREA